MPAKLTYLQVDKFRHVRPGTRVEFGSQINVLVGLNGAGKTTLLNLVSALVRNDFQQFSQEDFSLKFGLVDEEFTLEGMVSNIGGATYNLKLAGVLRHGSQSVHITGDVNASTITYLGQSFAGRRLGLRTDGLGEFGLLWAARLAIPTDIPQLAVLKPWQANLAIEALQYPAHICTRMGEGEETFLELFAHGPNDGKKAPTFGVTLIRHQGEKIAGVGDTLFHTHHLANDALRPLLNSQFPPKTLWSAVDVIAVDGTSPSLARFIELSQYTDARLNFVKTVTTADKLVFANPLARFTTKTGSEISHHQLSFGEKRLLAFLIKLHAYPPTIIVDELGNGMHHAWIERCLELIEDLGTQAFLSSQDPLLLDCLPLSRDAYGSVHTFVICELADPNGEMLWRNLTSAETEDFFRSHDVGIQHISEIMRIKGLW